MLLINTHVCSSENTRLLDFGEQMLMVAYDSIAYGSLLHIVAYEVPMHVSCSEYIIKHEKCKTGEKVPPFSAFFEIMNI